MSWTWLAGLVAGCEETYRDPDDARVALDPVLVGLAEEAERAHAAGDEKLGGQDAVNLADELVANVDSSLGHGATELQERQHLIKRAALRPV